MSNHPIVIFKKEYDGESVVDMERDVFESLNPDFNELAVQIPQDQHGFHEGTFTVTLSWKPNET